MMLIFDTQLPLILIFSDKINRWILYHYTLCTNDIRLFTALWDDMLSYFERLADMWLDHLLLFFIRIWKSLSIFVLLAYIYWQINIIMVRFIQTPKGWITNLVWQKMLTWRHTEYIFGWICQIWRICRRVSY